MTSYFLKLDTAPDHNEDALAALKIRSRLDLIDDRVYLTNFFGARNRSKLKEAGITHVVVCAKELPLLYESELEYLQLHLADNTTQALEPALTLALEFMERALSDDTARVLLHCAAGASRSASVAICWRMATKGESFEEALQHCQRQRRAVNPNPGFVEQLRKRGTATTGD